MLHNRRFVRTALLIAAASLAACGSQSGETFMPAAVAPASVASLTVPSNCAGQKTTAKSASMSQTLSSAGGSFCIPAFHGFGGTIFYPAASPSVRVKITSSTTNYNQQMPPLGHGKILFYVQLATSAGVTFAASERAGGGLTGKAIVPGKAYTAYGQASVDGFNAPLTPCYTIATKGKSGGALGGLGSLLTAQSIPTAATGFIEIYIGKLVSTKC
jgi:hypothetical protein